MGFGGGVWVGFWVGFEGVGVVFGGWFWVGFWVHFVMGLWVGFGIDFGSVWGQIDRGVCRVLGLRRGATDTRFTLLALTVSFFGICVVTCDYKVPSLEPLYLGLGWF